MAVSGKDHVTIRTHITGLSDDIIRIIAPKLPDHIRLELSLTSVHNFSQDYLKLLERNIDLYRYKSLDRGFIPYSIFKSKYHRSVICHAIQHSDVSLLNTCLGILEFWDVLRKDDSDERITIFYESYQRLVKSCCESGSLECLTYLRDKDPDLLRHTISSNRSLIAATVFEQKSFHLAGFFGEYVPALSHNRSDDPCRDIGCLAYYQALPATSVKLTGSKKEPSLFFTAQEKCSLDHCKLEKVQVCKLTDLRSPHMVREFIHLIKAAPCSDENRALALKTTKEEFWRKLYAECITGFQTHTSTALIKALVREGGLDLNNPKEFGSSVRLYHRKHSYLLSMDFLEKSSGNKSPRLIDVAAMHFNLDFVRILLLLGAKAGGPPPTYSALWCLFDLDHQFEDARSDCPLHRRYKPAKKSHCCTCRESVGSWVTKLRDLGGGTGKMMRFLLSCGADYSGLYTSEGQMTRFHPMHKLLGLTKKIIDQFDHVTEECNNHTLRHCTDFNDHISGRRDYYSGHDKDLNNEDYDKWSETPCWDIRDILWGLEEPYNLLIDHSSEFPHTESLTALSNMKKGLINLLELAGWEETRLGNEAFRVKYKHYEAPHTSDDEDYWPEGEERLGKDVRSSRRTKNKALRFYR
ncbi:hypothetical protein F5Y16DRAFT_401594 [Xylariaceae sp. FL0255]|nr:hypothetical protein F5Y16DRAFT_401594 [Xylariaceae sp. FL0255]